MNIIARKISIALVIEKCTLFAFWMSIVCTLKWSIQNHMKIYATLKCHWKFHFLQHQSEAPAILWVFRIFQNSWAFADAWIFIQKRPIGGSSCACDWHLTNVHGHWWGLSFWLIVSQTHLMSDTGFSQAFCRPTSPHTWAKILEFLTSLQKPTKLQTTGAPKHSRWCEKEMLAEMQVSLQKSVLLDQTFRWLLKMFCQQIVVLADWAWTTANLVCVARGDNGTCQMRGSDHWWNIRANNQMTLDWTPITESDVLVVTRKDCIELACTG